MIHFDIRSVVIYFIIQKFLGTIFDPSVELLFFVFYIFYVLHMFLSFVPIKHRNLTILLFRCFSFLFRYFIHK